MSGIGLIVTVIQSRLYVEKVFHKVAVSLQRFVVYKLLGRLFGRLAVGPYKVVAVFVALRLCRLLKPRVFDGGVACNQIEQHPDTFGMRLLDQGKQVIVGSETLIDRIEIDDVVTAVFPIARKTWREPYTVEPDAFDIIQPRTDTVQIADTVAVGIHIRRRIDVIDVRIVQPLRSAFGCRCNARQHRCQRQ